MRPNYVRFLRLYDEMPVLGMSTILSHPEDPDLRQIWCILWCEAQGYNLNQ